jgi:Holliday junction resolvasome RuvABC endonuclease subunit
MQLAGARNAFEDPMTKWKVLGIDPGQNCGWCLWDHNGWNRSGVIKLDAAGLSVLPDKVDVLAVEKTWMHGGHKNPGAAGKLLEATGWILGVGFYKWPDAQIYRPTPAQWRKATHGKTRSYKGEDAVTVTDIEHAKGQLQTTKKGKMTTHEAAAICIAEAAYAWRWEQNYQKIS